MQTEFEIVPTLSSRAINRLSDLQFRPARDQHRMPATFNTTFAKQNAGAHMPVKRPGKVSTRRIHSQAPCDTHQNSSAPRRQIAAPALTELPEPLLGRSLLLPTQVCERPARIGFGPFCPLGTSRTSFESWDSLRMETIRTGSGRNSGHDWKTKTRVDRLSK